MAVIPRWSRWRPTHDDEAMLRVLRVGSDIDDDVALVVTTSGTTGTPKGAMLTAAALTASAAATHQRLGGPGSWLLALPAYHIAGLQVLVRSVLAGSVPVELDVSGGFDISELPSAVRRLGSGRRYTSLVAAQLAKALTDPAATAALAELGCRADRRRAGSPTGPRRRRSRRHRCGPHLRDERDRGRLRLRRCRARRRPTARAARWPHRDRRRDAGQGLSQPRQPRAPDPFAEPGWFYTDDLGAIDESALRAC